MNGETIDPIVMGAVDSKGINPKTLEIVARRDGVPLDRLKIMDRILYGRLSRAYKETMPPPTKSWTDYIIWLNEFFYSIRNSDSKRDKRYERKLRLRNLAATGVAAALALWYANS